MNNKVIEMDFTERSSLLLRLDKDTEIFIEKRGYVLPVVIDVTIRGVSVARRSITYRGDKGIKFLGYKIRPRIFWWFRDRFTKKGREIQKEIRDCIIEQQVHCFLKLTGHQHLIPKESSSDEQ